MDFSFASIDLQSIHCITQKFHKVKKSSLHSLCIAAHFVLRAAMQFSKYFHVFCFLEHLSAQSHTGLHSASQRQHLLLHAPHRPWLNFEHQLVGDTGTCYFSNLTEQNPYEHRWQDWTTSANISHTMPPDSTRKKKAHAMSKRCKVRKKSWIVTERRNSDFSDWGDY